MLTHYPPRKHQLDDEAALECAHDLVAHAYRSMKHAAKESTVIQKHMTKSKVTMKHVLRRCHEFDPHLAKCVTFQLKHRLTAANKAERQHIAKLLYDRVEASIETGNNILRRVFFLDCKKLQISRGGGILGRSLM